MSHASSDNEVAEFEDAIRQVTIATWSRVRSTQELKEFVARRHAALADIEL